MSTKPNRVLVQLDDSHYDWLYQVAEERGCSMPAVLRALVNQEMAKSHIRAELRQPKPFTNGVRR